MAKIFTLRLAGDLKAAGANVWLDQQDILPGQRWDRAIEDALTNCTRMVVILSPASVSSTNVMDEVSFALEKQKTVIPVIYRDCVVPFRLHRGQHVDFTRDYARGLQALLKTLAIGLNAGHNESAVLDIASRRQSDASDPEKRAAEQAQVEAKRRKVAEQTGLEEECEHVTQQARAGQEHNRAVQVARLEGQGRETPEQAELREREREEAEPATQKKLLNKGWTGGLSASEFSFSRIVSRTTRLSIAAGSVISIVAIGSRLVFHYTEHWNARDSGTESSLLAIFGTGDGKWLWTVGEKGTILESDDGGQSWNQRARVTDDILESIFGTGNGKRMWAVGTSGTFLVSGDGEHWSKRILGKGHALRSIFATRDGKRLWIVGYSSKIWEAVLP